MISHFVILALIWPEDFRNIRELILELPAFA